MIDLMFFDIDTQNDFMLSSGKLYVNGAEQIIPNLQKLFDYAKTHNITIVSSTDAHKSKDDEFEQFPSHCVKGTTGQKKIDTTLLQQTEIIPNEKVDVTIKPNTQIIIEKETFDVFSNPNTLDILKRLNPGKVVVFGVATDYCVKAAVLSLIFWHGGGFRSGNPAQYRCYQGSFSRY